MKNTTEYNIEESYKNDKILRDKINEIDTPAILCYAKPENPHYFSIIHFNNEFYETFNFSSVGNFFGKSYEILFNRESNEEEQIKKLHLVRALKNGNKDSIYLDIVIDRLGGKKEYNFKITVIPYKIGIEKTNYAIFLFEKRGEKRKSSKQKNKNLGEVDYKNILLRDLETSLTNERILREVSNLIISKLSISNIIKQIARIICINFNFDRCLIHDFIEDKICNISEYYSDDDKSIIESFLGDDFYFDCNDELQYNQNNQNDLIKYIHFQNIFFQKVNKNSNSSMIILERIQENQSLSQIHQFCDKFNIASQLTTMIKINGKIIGAMYLKNSNNRDILPEEIDVVKIIADQLSIAIDRSEKIKKITNTNFMLENKTKELEISLKCEKEMRETQNNFVTLVSHEFKTPLQIIDATRELMARKISKLKLSEGNLLEDLNKIKGGISRMNDLISTTLDLAKIDNHQGQIKINLENFDIKKMIYDIIENLSILSSSKNIKVSIDMEEIESLFYGDLKMLNHAFHNIISNSIKYSNENSVVKIIATTKNQNIVFSIIDFGIGIPESQINNIGKKFFRASNTLSIAGTGVGIHIVKNFIDLHKGQFLIESKVNHGTKITVILPKNL